MILQTSAYERGRALQTDGALADLVGHPDAFIWVEVQAPEPDELQGVLDRLEMSDDFDAKEITSTGRRPALKVRGHGLELTVSTASYHDDEHAMVLGRLATLVNPRSVVSIWFGPGAVPESRESWAPDADQLSAGPLGVLVATLQEVVSDYSAALDGFENHLLDVEQSMLTGEYSPPLRLLYGLKRKLRRLQGPADALDEPFARLVHYVRKFGSDTLAIEIEEVSDQLDRVLARIRSLSDLIDTLLAAIQAEVNIRQNEDMRKISAWVAMGAVPTLFAGVYGMNFDHMPGTGWRYSFGVMMAVMVLAVIGLYMNFKKRNWL